MTHRRMPNERLRCLLDEADWTQEALARSVNAIGSEIGCPLRYDRTAVAHWLAGTLPREPVPELAAEALSRRIGRPVTPEAAGFGPGGTRSPARGTANAPTHDTDSGHTAGEATPGDTTDGFAAACRTDAEGARLAPMRQRPYRVAETEVPGPPSESVDDRTGEWMFDPRVTSPARGAGRAGNTSPLPVRGTGPAPPTPGRLSRPPVEHAHRAPHPRDPGAPGHGTGRSREEGPGSGTALWTDRGGRPGQTGRFEEGATPALFPWPPRPGGGRGRNGRHRTAGPRVEGHRPAGAGTAPALSVPAGGRPGLPLPVGKPDTGTPASPAPPPPAAPVLLDGGAELAALEDAIRFFAGSVNARGGRHARGALASYLADDVAPLLGSRRSTARRREVLVAACRLCFLLARMYEDGRLHGLAQRYYTFAHRLASEAGDRAAWSTVVRAMSAQAQRLGHPAAALRLAETAGRAVHGAPPGPQAYVQAQLAVVLALSGERRGALGALTAAERAAERVGDPPGPFDGYPTAALRFQSAAVLEALGDLPGAITQLRTAGRERDPADVRGHALTDARLGHLLLRRGHLEEACAAWEGLLRGRDRLRSEEVELAVLEMRRALRPHRGRGDAAEILARSLPSPGPGGG
ncbi:hypothetical protein [Streptomyces sp. ST2-7A]|uniref:hypothetical protein n=1 Tax=Streptomyces sp. ST2-7A TaxID=2907214 RepID=UPI001F17850C|nr:hypothetical protein [Streptomyces sp. ST2-7A]MCE7080772.1 hypothetical protein [Streptomyces sp. ST2-7A]